MTTKHLAVRKHLAGGIASVASLLALISASFAHQTFLWPQKFVWDEGKLVTVSLTSALSFPNLEHGPAKDRIDLTAIVTGGMPVDEVSFSENETVLDVQFMPARTGFSRIAVSSKPRAGDIAPEDAEEYFDEIGASAPVRAAFDALPGSPPLKRSYSKHAKLFICIEICGIGNKAATEPVGQPLEFVAVGDSAAVFKLLRDGEGLPEHAVTIVTTAGDTVDLSTAEGGTFVVPEGLTGAIMLTAVVITLPDTADGIYHSDYATLTTEQGINTID